jgi:hypothetical protein
MQQCKRRERYINKERVCISKEDTKMTEDKISINGIAYVKEDLLKEQETKKEDAERNLYSMDPANVMLIGKIKNFDDESKPLHLLFDFDRNVSELKLMVNLKRKERIEIWKGKEFWVAISREYYDKANKMIQQWKGETQIYVQKEKNLPILISGDDLGFVLAPRIEGDEQ